MKEELGFARGLRSFPAFPIALVTVEDNVITIGLVHVFSFNPPMLGIGVSPLRHSFSLLKNASEFGVSLSTHEMMQASETCGTLSGRDVDKWTEAGLTREEGKAISTPLVKECPVNIECRKVRELEFGGSHTWFVGEVVAARTETGCAAKDLQLYWNRTYWSLGEALARPDRPSAAPR